MKAQEEKLVSTGSTYGGYGAPYLKIGVFNGNAGLLSGGKGAFIINHKFAIGGGNYNTSYNINSDIMSSNSKPLYINLHYAGIELEYIHNSDKVFHWTLLTLIGGGKIKLLEQNPELTIEIDNMVVVDPSLNAELNINKWFRICAGVTYPIYIGMDLVNMKKSVINGPTGQIIFKFGRF